MDFLLPLDDPRPIPHLPMEIKAHILAFCPPSDLATASRVSLAFLQLSSSILYQHIDIVGLENLSLLFCSRDAAHHQPQLSRYLNLHHSLSITISATSSTPGSPRSLQLPQLSHDRLGLPSSSTSTRRPSLPVNILTLRPIGLPGDSHAQLSRWISILPFFDPSHVQIVGLPSNELIPRFSLHVAPWSNLKHLVLANVSSVGYLDSSKVFFEGGGNLVDVTFDLSLRWGDDAYERELKAIVSSELAPRGDRIVGGRFGRVIVRVGREEEGWQVEEMVMEKWREEGTAEEFGKRGWRVEVGVVEEKGRGVF